MTSAADHTARQARTLAQIAIPLLFAGIVLPVIGSSYLAAFETALGSRPAAEANQIV